MQNKRQTKSKSQTAVQPLFENNDYLVVFNWVFFSSKYIWLTSCCSSVVTRIHIMHSSSVLSSAFTCIGGDLVQDRGRGRRVSAEFFFAVPKMRNWGDGGDSLSLGTKCWLSITVHRVCTLYIVPYSLPFIAWIGPIGSGYISKSTTEVSKYK